MPTSAASLSALRSPLWQRLWKAYKDAKDMPHDDIEVAQSPCRIASLCSLVTAEKQRRVVVLPPGDAADASTGIHGARRVEHAPAQAFR